MTTDETRIMPIEALLQDGADAAAAPKRVSPFYSTVEAAEFLHLSPRTLEKMRLVGGGPPFCKLGRRAFYTLPDLKEWAARRRCNSTSDPACKSPPVGP
jgi:hypothetical protein